MSISLTDIVNKTMATFIKGSMCEILALISAQQKEIIKELEKVSTSEENTCGKRSGQCKW